MTHFLLHICQCLMLLVNHWDNTRRVCSCGIGVLLGRILLLVSLVVLVYSYALRRHPQSEVLTGIFVELEGHGAARFQIILRILIVLHPQHIVIIYWTGAHLRDIAGLTLMVEMIEGLGSGGLLVTHVFGAGHGHVWNVQNVARGSSCRIQTHLLLSCVGILRILLMLKELMLVLIVYIFTRMPRS